MTMPPTENTPARTALWVINRDGTKVPFDLERITTAIAKAGRATGEFDAQQAAALAQCVLAELVQESCNVEMIQNLVELTLIRADFLKTARAYIAYREQHQQLRCSHQAMVNAVTSVNEFLQRQDWRVQANANQGNSLGGLILNVAGKVTANYWLEHVYPAAVRTAHRKGDFHIHDLDMLSGYCAGWSLRTVLAEGFNGVGGKVEAAPPKHLSSAVGQMVNFLGTL